MGYYTMFNLTVHTDKFSEEEIIGKFRKENKYAEYCFDENGGAEEEAKWYDHEEDLKEFSKKYPDVLFELHGKGEESGDMWVLYVKNGMSHRETAKITFAKFDPAKLE